MMMKVQKLINILQYLQKKSQEEIAHYNNVFKANLIRYGVLSILILGSILHPHLLGYQVLLGVLEGTLLLSSFAACYMNEVINFKKVPFWILYAWALNGLSLSSLLSKPSLFSEKLYLIYDDEIETCLKYARKSRLLKFLNLGPNVSDIEIKQAIQQSQLALDPDEYCTALPKTQSFYTQTFKIFTKLVESYKKKPESEASATQNADNEVRKALIIRDEKEIREIYEVFFWGLSVQSTRLLSCIIYVVRLKRDATFRHLAQQGINFMSLELATKWRVYTQIFCNSYLKFLPYIGILGVLQICLLTPSIKFSDLNLRRDSGLATVIKFGIQTMGIALIPCIIGILPIPIIQTHFIVNFFFQCFTCYGLTTGLDNIVSPLIAKADIAIRKLIGVPQSIVDKIIQECDPPFSPDEVPQDVRLQRTLN